MLESVSVCLRTLLTSIGQGSKAVLLKKLAALNTHQVREDIDNPRRKRCQAHPVPGETLCAVVTQALEELLHWACVPRLHAVEQVNTLGGKVL